MPDQKIDNLLNLAMDATPQERRKSGNLNVGYDPATRLWDVIIKYSGPESGLAGNGIQVVPLLGSYAVVTLPESEIDEYSHRVQVEFMEKPKRLYFELFQAKGASCIRTVQTGRNGLTGKGILTGVVDSGVDYFHPDFRNADGSSRILRLWDQSIQGNPPQGYVTGTEYTKEQIDEALALGENQGRRLVPSSDYCEFFRPFTSVFLLWLKDALIIRNISFSFFTSTGGFSYRSSLITALPTLGLGIKQLGGTFATIFGFA